MPQISGLEIGFTEGDYRCDEEEGSANVLVARDSSITLASDLMVYVTPLTFQEAAMRGISTSSTNLANASRKAILA